MQSKGIVSPQLHTTTICVILTPSRTILTLAFRYYNRCRWDYPESEAGKYARGRLALPEMLAQFEREADLEDE
jgi:hypothetical protein